MSDQFLSERLHEIKNQKRRRNIFLAVVFALFLIAMIGLSRIGFFPEQVRAINTILAPTQTSTKIPTVTATFTPTFTPLPTDTLIPSPTYTSTPIPPVRGVALGDVYVRDYPDTGSVFLTLQEGEDILIVGYWGNPETGWYKVNLGAKDGWVVRKMIKLIDELPREFEIFSLP